MAGRFGGDIKGRRDHRNHKTPWQVSRSVLEAIGRNARPDLEAIGRRTRRLTQPPKAPEPAKSNS